MKKLIIPFAFLLPFLFSSCDSDDNTSQIKDLNNTVWEYITMGGDPVEKYIISFYKSTFKYAIYQIQEGAGSKDPEIDPGHVVLLKEIEGTYTYSAPTAILKMEGESDYIGTVIAKEMYLNKDENIENTRRFIKKEK